MIIMRHGESKFIEKFYSWRKERKAAGLIDENLTEKEIANREIAYCKFAISEPFVDAVLTDHGIKTGSLVKWTNRQTNEDIEPLADA